jgi:hypothetical protein
MGSLSTIGGGASGGGGGAVQPVTAPAATSQAVAAGGSFAGVTFGAFTDPGGRIDATKYLATTTNASGSTSWSGTGLGAYTASGSADGDAGTLTLTARDSSSNPLATAVHVFERASAGGAAWVNTLDLDVTAMTSTTLSAGNNTVDGRVVYSEDAGVTIGGGSGITPAATRDAFIEVSSAFTGQENPKMVEIKIVNQAWGGINTGHAMRARLVSTTATGGQPAPSAQTRYYPVSSGAMRLAPQWQSRYPTNTGTFSSSGGSYDHSGDGAVLTWYSYLACVRGSWFAWISKTQAPATTLADLLTPDAATWSMGVNSYSVLGSAAYWPATAFVGLFAQDASSVGALTNVRCWEFK